VYDRLLPDRIWVQRWLKQFIVDRSRDVWLPQFPAGRERTIAIQSLVHNHLLEACAALGVTGRAGENVHWPPQLSRLVAEYGAFDEWEELPTYTSRSALRELSDRLRACTAPERQPRLRPHSRTSASRFVKARRRRCPRKTLRELHAAYVDGMRQCLDGLRAGGYTRLAPTAERHAVHLTSDRARAIAEAQASDPEALALPATAVEIQRGELLLKLTWQCPFCVRGEHRRSDGCPSLPAVAKTAREPYTHYATISAAPPLRPRSQAHGAPTAAPTMMTTRVLPCPCGASFRDPVVAGADTAAGADSGADAADAADASACADGFTAASPAAGVSGDADAGAGVTGAHCADTPPQTVVHRDSEVECAGATAEDSTTAYFPYWLFPHGVTLVFPSGRS